MEYSILGASCLKVSRFTLDMSGNATEAGFVHETCAEILRCGLELGINAIYTSDICGLSQQDELLLKPIRGMRGRLIIGARIGNAFWDCASHDESQYSRVISMTENGIRALGLDYFDIMLIHLDNVFSRIDENIRALESLISRGLVRYMGFYNSSTWRVSEEFLRQRDLPYPKFTTAQMHYSLLDRSIEYELVPYLSEANIGLQVRDPFRNGTGKHFLFSRPGSVSLGTEQPGSDSNEDAILNALCNKHLIKNPAAISLAWLLSRRFVSTVMLKPENAEVLEEYVSAFDVSLSAADSIALDALAEPQALAFDLGFSDYRIAVLHEA